MDLDLEKSQASKKVENNKNLLGLQVSVSPPGRALSDKSLGGLKPPSPTSGSSYHKSPALQVNEKEIISDERNELGSDVVMSGPGNGWSEQIQIKAPSW